MCARSPAMQLFALRRIATSLRTPRQLNAPLPFQIAATTTTKGEQCGTEDVEGGREGSATLTRCPHPPRSTYYGAFSSNHAPQTAPYLTPLLDWVAPGRALAQRVAGDLHLECDPATLMYACHLAPWGMQSWDESV